MKRLTGWLIAAALAFLAQGAAAQAPAGTAPAPASGGAGAPQGGVDNPTAPATIQQIHSINAKMIQIGKLAAERGATTNVKEYGQRIASEHERLDRELSEMAQRRGIPLAPAEQITADPAHATSIPPLMAKSGLEFDRAVMDALVKEREERVPELKALRDRTPGKDAELKKWVDDMEVVMEKTRNEARNVRQAVVQQQQQQQRQGRKP